MREGARAFAASAGEFAHDKLTRDQLERDLQLYVLTPQDAEHIGDPLANIANRHLRAAGVAANPDIGDIVGAVAGFAVYAGRQLSLWLVARRVRKAIAAAGEQGGPTEAPASPTVDGSPA